MSQSEPEVLAKGYTSTVYRHPTRLRKVIKVLDEKDSEALFQVERRAYERLNDPDRPRSIVEYFGTDDQLKFGLVLELLPRGDLYGYLWNHPPVRETTKRSWAHDAAEALSFVHAHGILHCDIHALNFFLDATLNLKLGDFGAASIDGERPLLMYRTSHQLLLEENGEWRRQRSVASEIFALGCVFYNIETSNGLFSVDGREIERDEIVRRMKERDYPELGEDIVLRGVIGKCWTLEYETMNGILDDLADDLSKSDE